MPITVEIQDEVGRTIVRLGFITVLPWLLATDQDHARFPWLSSIDPYGDTTFNPLQAAHVRRELTDLISENRDSDALGELKMLAGWLGDLGNRSEPGLYLKLMGD
jgi:hypothetical protein